MRYSSDSNRPSDESVPIRLTRPSLPHRVLTRCWFALPFFVHE